MSRIFRIFYTAVLFTTVAGFVHPDVLRVPDDYQTIQQAIDAANDGDTVLVAPGTYVGSIDFKGKPITVKSAQGAKATVIDGNQTGSVVYFWNREGMDSVLEGFTVTNGIGTKWPYHHRNGGGILVGPSSSGPTIKDNLIAGNEVKFQGGGVYCLSSAPCIVNNTIANNISWSLGAGITCHDFASPLISGNCIVDNSCDNGGGIFCRHSSPAVMNNEISHNAGGGIYARSGSRPTVERNKIHGNTSIHWIGGGVSIENPDGPVMISGNIIYDNQAVQGGGIGLFGCQYALIINNTIFGNATYSGCDGGGLSLQASTGVVVNTVLYDNEAPQGAEISLAYVGGPTSQITLIHSNVKGGLNSVFVDKGNTLYWGPGMLFEDPLFADPWNGDFHLLNESACIDAGDNKSYPLEKLDFEGDPRIFPGNGQGAPIGFPQAGAVVDMGADEYCQMKRGKSLMK